MFFPIFFSYAYTKTLLFYKDMSIFFINFYWVIDALQCFISILLYRKMNESYVYTDPLLFQFSSCGYMYTYDSIYHRALSRIPCATE